MSRDWTQPWALVLAGGDGCRLRELTRQITGRPIPKQFCRILGEHSLLETTLARARHLVPPSQLLVLLNAAHRDLSAEHLHGLPPASLLVQPCNRDTGPAIVMGLLGIARRDPEALVIVFPSDHYVDDDAAFMEYVRGGLDVVRGRPDTIAILGVEPDEADDQLGYIELGERIHHWPPAYAARSFVEKPDPATARQLARAGALWNSFVMIFRASRMLELLALTVPDDLRRIRRVAADRHRMRERFAQLMPWSFSVGALSKLVAHLAVVRVDGVQWSDWGSRRAIERTFARLSRIPPWQTAAG